MLEAEVFVLGSGPAGCSAALNLAPLHRTVVADRRPCARGRLVESLPPVAGRVLADMGVLDAFVAEGHGRWQVKRSVWEGPEAVEDDLLRNPDGLGWHLDRARFGAWLRSVAVARGATVVAPAEMERVDRDCDGRWRVRLATPSGPLVVSARVVVDAAGRSAPLAVWLGARRQRLDRLVCGWVEGRDRNEGPGQARQTETFLEAAEDGWWYSAPVAGRRLLAFYTDADLPPAHVTRDPARLLHLAHSHRELGGLLAATGFEPTGGDGFTAAHSAILHPCAGPGWLAAGDAAISFDPVSSQGLLTAIVTGLAASEAAHRALAGVTQPSADYMRMVADVWTRYRHNLRDCYRAVTRWPASPFWARRQDGEAAGAQPRTPPDTATLVL